MILSVPPGVSWLWVRTRAGVFPGVRGRSGSQPRRSCPQRSWAVAARSSPGYDEARRVWNLAYDRRPLAIVRAVNLEDVQRCVEYARKHTVPIAIRGGGHSYAGYGVADGALQIDLSTFSTVTVDRRPPSHLSGWRHPDRGPSQSQRLIVAGAGPPRCDLIDQALRQGDRSSRRSSVAADRLQRCKDSLLISSS